MGILRNRCCNAFGFWRCAIVAFVIRCVGVSVIGMIECIGDIPADEVLA